jgi:hypothetical protein
MGKHMKATVRIHRAMAAPRLPVRYGTFEVARFAGVTVRTVYNWLSEGKIAEPERSSNGYRLWTPEAVATAIELNHRIKRGQGGRR